MKIKFGGNRNTKNGGEGQRSGGAQFKVSPNSS
jgi:hypothetical protein